ncbi:MAG: HlyC/CorC family transporter [Verrucomicrobia bacterium]|nr:HlyC/CorC family transporter [Verrucomicrobiota bacterium]
MNWDLVFVVGLKILAVLVLVMLNGFFVATEFALVKVRHTQLSPLVAKGNRRAMMASHIISHLDAYLSAAQLGITLASLALGWIGEPIFADLLRPVFGALGWAGQEHETLRHTIAFIIGFGSITFLHIVAGEQAPKSFGIRQPLQTALWVAYPMRAFYFIAFPFIWVLNESSLGLLRVLGLQPAHEHEGVSSEEELRVLVSTSQQHFGASSYSRDLVQSAMDLRHRSVRDVMRPRQEIVVLDTESTVAECLDVAEKTRYSRFPLCDGGDLDKTLGAVHIKDLFAMRLKIRTGAELLPVARKIIYVPETARLERVLQLFLERKLHFAVVVDEYGGTVGMVTLENIVEELVGQIQDEFDQEKPLQSRISETTWDVAGALPLHDLEELVGEQLRDAGVTTTSGWVTQRLGGFPKPGDVVSVGTCELRVEEMEGTLVARLRLTRKAV